MREERASSTQKPWEIHEVNEITRKEDGEEVGLPDLWMATMVAGFQQNGKNCENQDLLKRERRRSCACSDGCLIREKAMEEVSLGIAAESSGRKRGTEVVKPRLIYITGHAQFIHELILRTPAVHGE